MNDSLSTCIQPRQSGHLYTRDALDVDEHASNLSAWEQRYDQISAGRFIGGVTELWTPRTQVFYEHTSRVVRQQCKVWPDAWWFGIPVCHDGTRMNGKEAPSGAILVHRGDAPFELVTPAEHRIFGIVVQKSALEQFCADQGLTLDWQQLAQVRWVQTSTEAHRQAVNSLQALFTELKHNALAEGHAHAQRNLEYSLLELLLPFVHAGEASGLDCAGSQRHRQVVGQILAQARVQHDWVPSIPELCAQFHVSRRTLQYAFEEVLGTSPANYLRAVRLNGVRRTLRTGQFASVQDAAAAWGFWNLSQFSADYRRFFDERPSETLQRPDLVFSDGFRSALEMH